MHPFDVRIAAYGVIVDAVRVLLTHYVGAGEDGWTLPGGGLELGEDGEAAALREILEETGYEVALDGLLGAHSLQIPPERRIVGRRHLHALRLVYRARVVGGTLRPEAAGSTDDVRWVPLGEVPSLPCVDLVDVGLRLWRAPSTGA